MKHFLLAIFFILSACTSGVSTSTKMIPLTWEKNHPERASWSQILEDQISQNLAAFKSAKDILKIRSDFNKLSASQQVNVLAEFFSSDAYYESSWDPTEYSVDVGTDDDKGSWSVGLWQMSVDDQESYDLKFGYTFADLQTVKPNAVLAVTIMAQQIKNYGLILIPWSQKSHVYWSTLSPGNKDDKSASIISDVQAMSF